MFPSSPSIPSDIIVSGLLIGLPLSYAKAMQEDMTEVVDEEEYDIYLYLLYGSSVLIGSHAYSESELGNEFKEKYLDTVKQCPSLLAYTIFNLEQSLIQRETRRAGVGDHQTGEDRFKQKQVAEKFGFDLNKLPNSSFLYLKSKHFDQK